jgi:hypothetical protein
MSDLSPSLNNVPAGGDAPALGFRPTDLPKLWAEGDELPHRDVKRSHRDPEPEPKVGMGVTMGYGSDCYPGTIVKVSPSGHAVWVVDDRHTYTGPPRPYGDPGKDEDWHYFRTADNEGKKATRRQNGRYAFVGSHQALNLGARRYYQDPHF